MFKKNKLAAIFAVLVCFNISNVSQCVVFAQTQTQLKAKYPDYAYEYLGHDKFESFNRKMFAFNMKLNKYAVRPVHMVWASIMPKYGIERIENIHTNMVYPRRLVSCLIQKNFKGSGTETVRFLTNTTLGLGGMFDPAKSIFKIEPLDEDMEQALAKCKIKRGPYMVVPMLVSTTPRDLAGRLLDWALDPSSYIAGPIMAAVKAGLFINRTSYIQPLTVMLESTYADPYDIARKFYGLENYIKNENLDRKNLLTTTVQIMDENYIANNPDNYIFSDITAYDAEPDIKVINVNSLVEAEKAYDVLDNKLVMVEDAIPLEKTAILEIGEPEPETKIIAGTDKLMPPKLKADIVLKDYNPQNPVVDSMRTALFELPGVDDSIWSEISIWNRSFSRRIKTSSVNIVQGKQNYKYRYILQKDKNSPVAIIYPSIGESIMSHHSDVLAKLFYDEGYSVIIQGSHFQWEFVKSMPDSYKPGDPSQDADYLKIVTNKIVKSLQDRYDCKFNGKTVIGTSFGALTTLFLASKEYDNNTLDITKYISINPPVELTYAMHQIDKNTDEWHKNPDNLKERVAMTAAKVIQLYNLKDQKGVNIETLPFSEEEGKLITGFIMHQKLSDLIFTLENAPKNSKSNIYEQINNMNYMDYAQKYILSNGTRTFDELAYDASLYSISDFLESSDKYKIYHTVDDYLVTPEQLGRLKEYAGNKAVYVSNGGHLGFLYRKEFIHDLRKEISLKNQSQEDNIVPVGNVAVEP